MKRIPRIWTKRSCTNKTYKKRRDSESILQVEFANWLADEGILYNASCSGMRTFPKVMAKMRRMGAKKGFPDIIIFEVNTLFHGLTIELKSETGKATKEQKEWQEALYKKGYCALIMPSGLVFEEGFKWLKEKVNWYMGIKK